MARLRELCDAAIADHGAVQYDKLMGTLNEEFGPQVVQEKQEPIKKVVTSYPGHSIVRSQNLWKGELWCQTIYIPQTNNF